MIRDIQYYKNRIALLQGRANRANGKIIAKLQRQIRALEKENSNA